LVAPKFSNFQAGLKVHTALASQPFHGMEWKKTSYRFFWKVSGSNWVNGAPLTRLILYEATYRCFGTTLNFQFFFFSIFPTKKIEQVVHCHISILHLQFFLQQSEVHTRSHVHKKPHPLTYFANKAFTWTPAHCN